MPDDPNPRDTLRAAAALIRSSLDGVRPGPWDVSVDQDRPGAPVEVADCHGATIATTGAASDQGAIAHAQYLELCRPEVMAGIAVWLGVVAERGTEEEAAAQALGVVQHLLYPEPIAGDAYSEATA